MSAPNYNYFDIFLQGTAQQPFQPVTAIFGSVWNILLGARAILTLTADTTLQVVSKSGSEGYLLVTGNGHSITFTEGGFTQTIQTKAEGDTLIVYANYAGNREVWVDNAVGGANLPTGGATVLILPMDDLQAYAPAASNLINAVDVAVDASYKENTNSVSVTGKVSLQNLQIGFSQVAITLPVPAGSAMRLVGMATVSNANFKNALVVEETGKIAVRVECPNHIGETVIIPFTCTYSK